MMKRFFAIIVSVLPLFFASCSKVEFEGDYVDLGLSVKWAKCNLGASSPGRYGGYYAWGETDSKMVFNGRLFKYYDFGTPTPFKKYCNDPEKGIVDSLSRIECCDDAASVALGGRWRIPTSQEIAELFEKCECCWTDGCDEYDQVPGYLFYSKLPGYEGRVLFLPALGRIDDCYSYKDRKDGYYLTSDLSEEDCSYALCMHFNREENPCLMSLWRVRNGFQIRPVRE